MVTSLACLCNLDDAILHFPAKSYSSHILALLLTTLFPKFSTYNLSIFKIFYLLYLIFNFLKSFSVISL